MSKIKIFSLGGLNENGKNMYIVNVDENIFILDAGLKYADDKMLGVDYIIPNFDCNKIPSCLIAEEELEQFRVYLGKRCILDNISRSNISNTLVKCNPVIDIRQDLTAVRCFGLSEYTKQNIRDFKCIKDLENYYIRTVDAFAYNTAYSDKCVDCYDRKTLKCNGGCLAFKINEILTAREMVFERLDRKGE